MCAQDPDSSVREAASDAIASVMGGLATYSTKPVCPLPLFSPFSPPSVCLFLLSSLPPFLPLLPSPLPLSLYPFSRHHMCFPQPQVPLCTVPQGPLKPMGTLIPHPTPPPPGLLQLDQDHPLVRGLLEGLLDASKDAQASAADSLRKVRAALNAAKTPRVTLIPARPSPVRPSLQGAACLHCTPALVRQVIKALSNTKGCLAPGAVLGALAGVADADEGSPALLQGLLKATADPPPRPISFRAAVPSPPLPPPSPPLRSSPLLSFPGPLSPFPASKEGSLQCSLPGPQHSSLPSLTLRPRSFSSPRTACPGGRRALVRVHRRNRSGRETPCDRRLQLCPEPRVDGPEGSL